MASSTSLGAVGLLAATHHGAFTRRLAAELGMTKHGIASLIRRGVIEEAAPGLLIVVGSPATFLRLAHAATLIVGARGAIADSAAGRLHTVDGIDVPSVVSVVHRKGVELNVGSLSIRARSSRSGLDAADVVEMDGLRVTGLARTICDLAGDPTAPPLARMIDDFERRGLSLTWLEHTAVRLRARGRIGPGSVVREIEERRVRRSAGTQVRGSWFQKLVVDCLASCGLPGLVEEYEIRDDAGRVVARCDLAMPAIRLGIEAHSRRHHFGGDSEAYDEQRDNRVTELGWVLRYVTWADQQRHPRELRAYFERLAARRAADLGVRLHTF